jgi:hypothetical protein
MKLELFEYSCIKGHNFSAPSLGEAAYGDFLLWSSSGKMTYLNAFQDPTYKVADEALQALKETASVQPRARAGILQRIYGPTVCDPDDNGAPFRLDRMCPCPQCGTQEMNSWGPKRPPEVVHIPVSSVTHARWFTLSAAEQNLQLETAVKQA